MDTENFPFIKTICYSTIGKRSCSVVRELLAKGVKAYSLEGGLIKWCNYEKWVTGLLLWCVEASWLIPMDRRHIWFTFSILTTVLSLIHPIFVYISCSRHLCFQPRRNIYIADRWWNNPPSIKQSPRFHHQQTPQYNRIARTMTSFYFFFWLIFLW